MIRYIAAIGLTLGLLGSGGVAFAQQESGGVINADGTNAASSPNEVSNAEGPTVVYGDIGPGTTIIDVPPADSSPSKDAIYSVPGVNGDISATDGNASILGAGDASAAPGRITSNGSGLELLGPDGTYSVTETTPSDVTLGVSGEAPPPVYEPVAEPAPETAPIEETAVEPAPVDETGATETAVAEGTTDAAAVDSDADNITDAVELEYGTDPYNIDGDADGVADGDEINIYGTDPFTFDTDGDGTSDGGELFDTRTDPLTWDDFSTAGTETVAQEVAAEPAPVEEAAVVDESAVVEEPVG
jgi:hypothetical protein